MNPSEYAAFLRGHAAAREVLEGFLWQAQLREFPDSKRVEVEEAYGWLNESAPPLDEEWWHKEYGRYFTRDDRRREALNLYATKRTADYRLRIARGLALALQFPVFVIYECGKVDGTYLWRGIRYGVAGSEYQSGLSREV
jgi:hypothetical protein